MEVDEVVDEIVLAHFGTKGMKWGQRRAARKAARTVEKRKVTVEDKEKKFKSKGGSGIPAHPEAVKARTFQQISKESGFKALSNKELQAYNQRMNLEQQAKRLRYQDQSAARRFIQTIMFRNVGKGVEASGRAGGSAVLGYTLGQGSVRKRMATGAAAMALMA